MCLRVVEVVVLVDAEPRRVLRAHVGFHLHVVLAGARHQKRRPVGSYRVHLLLGALGTCDHNALVTLSR